MFGIGILDPSESYGSSVATEYSVPRWSKAVREGRPIQDNPIISLARQRVKLT